MHQERGYWQYAFLISQLSLSNSGVNNTIYIGPPCYDVYQQCISKMKIWFRRMDIQLYDLVYRQNTL